MTNDANAVSQPTPEQWQHIEDLLDEALDLPPEDRTAYLDRACPDAALRAVVERLLAADAQAGTFLDQPAHALASPLLDTLDDGQESPDEAASLGQRIAAYRLVRALGRGGMGTVYLAERIDGQFEHHVALKLIRRGMDTDFVLRRFLQERQILARLQHPGIARLLDGDVTPEGQPYFVMEYIEGQPITDYCAAHNLDLKARLRLFLHVAEAVQYAHRNLVVHRDLKPSNILVTQNPGSGPGQAQVKLLDFGIAKMLDEDPTDTAEADILTRTGQLIMTPEYAAPEQVRGEAVTTATDVYALGVLLYELLTGVRPYRFERLTPTEIERVVCEQEPLKPSTAVLRAAATDGQAPDTAPFGKQLRGDLDTIVMMALRKEPERRYGSVEQFTEDLRRYLDGLPVLAREDTVGYRARKFFQRHRLGVVAASVVVAALVAGLTVALWQARVAADERDRARLEAEKAEEVATFLRDLFVASDPEKALGDTLTVRAILERGAARIRTDLQDQPAVQGMLMGEMGRIYDNLGLYARADSFLQDALAVQRQVLGAAHPDIAANLHERSQVKDYLGDYEASEQLAQEALAMRRVLLEDTHPDVAESMDWVASILAYKGDYDEAEPLARQAVATLQSTVGEEDVRAATAMHNLAWLLSQKGDYDEAEPIYRRVVEIGRRTVGAEHPETLTSINNLAVLLRRKGDLEGAEPLYREVLALQQKTLGARHSQVGVTLHNLARLIQVKGALDEAAALYEQALSVWRESLGPAHPNIATGLSNLAALEHERERLAESEALFHQALALQRQTLPEKHARIAETLVRFGRLLMAQNRAEEAEPSLREALDIRRQHFADDHVLVAETNSVLGLCLLAQGTSEEAAALLRANLPILEAERGDDDPLVREARAALDQVG